MEAPTTGCWPPWIVPWMAGCAAVVGVPTVGAKLALQPVIRRELRDNSAGVNTLPKADFCVRNFCIGGPASGSNDRQSWLCGGNSEAGGAPIVGSLLLTVNLPWQVTH